jgi:hypothetical protein
MGGMYADWMKQLDNLEKSLNEWVSKEDVVAIYAAFTPVLPALYAAARKELDAFKAIAEPFKKDAAKFDSDGRDAQEFGERFFVVMRAFKRVQRLAAAIERELTVLRQEYPEMIGTVPQKS